MLKKIPLIVLLFRQYLTVFFLVFCKFLEKRLWILNSDSEKNSSFVNFYKYFLSNMWNVFIVSSFFLFIYYLFYFTILYWFCHTLTCIHHECTCVPHPKPPSHLPPHSILLGHPSAPALSTLYHASNLDWRFVSHMIIYMFQCHSPISSHPRPLPQSPKDCSIICVSFAVSHTGLSLPSF